MAEEVSVLSHTPRKHRPPHAAGTVLLLRSGLESAGEVPVPGRSGGLSLPGCPQRSHSPLRSRGAAVRRVLCGLCVLSHALAQPGSSSIDPVSYMKPDHQGHGEHPLETPWLNPLATAEGHGQVQAAGS